MATDRPENDVLDLRLPPLDGEDDEATDSDLAEEELDAKFELDEDETNLDGDETSSQLLVEQELVDESDLEDDGSILAESEPIGDLIVAEEESLDDSQRVYEVDDDLAAEHLELDDLNSPLDVSLFDDRGDEGVDDVVVEDGPDDEIALAPLSKTEEDGESLDSREDETFGLELLREVAATELENDDKTVPDAALATNRLDRPITTAKIAAISQQFGAEKDLGADNLTPSLISIIEPLEGVVSVGSRTIAWGNGIYALGGAGVTKLSTRGLPRVAIQSVAIDPTNAQRLIVGTDTDVYRSKDGGSTFEPTSVLDSAASALGVVDEFSAIGQPRFQVAFTQRQGDDRSRLWTLTPQGELQFSLDLGDNWCRVDLGTRVSKIAADGGNTIAVLTAEPRQVVLRANAFDHWQRWSKIDLPPGDNHKVSYFAACQEVLLLGIGSTAVIFFMAGAAAWKPLFQSGSGPISLTKERGVIAAYRCVLRRPDSYLVIRWPLFPAIKNPAVVLRLDGAPKSLCAVHFDGVTTLDVITNCAWYRAKVRQTPL